MRVCITPHSDFLSTICQSQLRLLQAVGCLIWRAPRQSWSGEGLWAHSHAQSDWHQPQPAEASASMTHAARGDTSV